MNHKIPSWEGWMSQ